MAVKQSKQDLINHLKEHCEFLILSAQSFDNGYTSEAKRMATTLRVLLHDTDRSHSILNQLKLKTNMRYLNTASPYDEKNLLSHHGLVGLKFSQDSGASYFSLLDDLPFTPKRVSFPEWWNEIVICDGNNNKFCRRELILTIANRDGGAHVDPKLDNKYAALTRHNSVGWFVNDGNASTPISNIELFSVRQMAHEFLLSIQKKVPGVFV